MSRTTATAAFRLHKSVVSTLSLLLATSLSACGGRDGEGARASSERVVRNTRESGWPTARAWRLSPAGVIAGTDAGGAATTFGHLVDVAIDPLGRVWAADGMQQAIHVFEWNGRHVRTIGRKGAGPAEFASIAGMAWAPDGSLWVLDAGNGRFTVFDTAGVPASTAPRRHTASVTPWPGAFDRYGRLVDLAQRRLVGDELHVALVRSDPRTGGGDTLQLPPLKEMYFGEVTSGSSRRQSVKRAPIPFTATQLWAVDPEGFAWVAVTDRYRVERIAFDGTIDLALELVSRARPVSRADKTR
ncbi:MAG TPA: 6-bladed beta-propeller, partial [Longimicrobium sp.]|nr:6-bladed beta-propeller [Longimicrobium sp.]